jgi:hypothetical protein
MFVTLSGIVKPFMDSQKANAPDPICVTLSGIITELRAVHPQNRCLSMEVKPPGMAMDVRDEQFMNACSPIIVTVVGIVTVLRGQLRKAPFPIYSIPLGRVIVLRPLW